MTCPVAFDQHCSSVVVVACQSDDPEDPSSDIVQEPVPESCCVRSRDQASPDFAREGRLHFHRREAGDQDGCDGILHKFRHNSGPCLRMVELRDGARVKKERGH
jgi:hypothetical protein